MVVNTKVLVIGAGPAGLATGARLKKANLPFIMLEREDKVVSSWHRMSHKLTLHTTKTLSNLPFAPFPSHYLKFPSRGDLVKYYESYAVQFDLKPKFKQEVKSIKKNDQEEWVTQTLSDTYISEYIVLATGLNRVPSIPDFEGIQEFEGKLLHSHFYEDFTVAPNERVLIVGMGNTGAEIALDLVEKRASTSLTVNSPVVIVPKSVLGRSFHSISHAIEKMPPKARKIAYNLISNIYIGNLSKYGLKQVSEPSYKISREKGGAPVVDAGTVALIKNREVKILPPIKRLTKDGVLLQDGTSEPFDSIIMATGYDAGLSDFIMNIHEELNESDIPANPIAQQSYLKGMYFVGFDNRKIDGILTTILHDSEVVVHDISRQLSS